MLPFTVCEEDSYKNKIRQAKKMIEKIDAADVHLLTLALKLSCPIWSNDKDFEGLGVEVYSTPDLIR